MATLSLNAQFYPAVKYSKQDGMPSNSIFDITQDHKKVMWFATSEGMCSYDGREWKLQPDSLSLPTSEYTLLKLTDDGRLWAAGQNRTNFVIACLHEGKWKKIQLPPKLYVHNGAFTFDVMSGPQGLQMWVSVDGTLFEYTESNNTWNEFPVTFKINSIQGYSGKAYLSTLGGLKILSEGIISEVKLPTDLPNNDVLAITFHEDGFYLLGFNWLGRFVNGEIMEMYEDIGIFSKSRLNKYNIIVDHRGRVFFSCYSPLYRLNKVTGKGDIIEIDNRIRYAKCNRAYVDQENNIWVGDHRGLFRFNLLRFSNYNHETGLLDQEVSAIFQRSDGTILVANPTAINELDRFGKVTKNLPIPIPDEIEGRVLDIAENDQGRVFLACGLAGLWIMEGDQFRKVIKRDDPDLWSSSVELWNGTIYTTSGLGIYSVKNRRYELSYDIRGGRNAIAINAEHMMVATPRGVYVIHSSGTVEHKTSELRDLNNVYDLASWHGRTLVATQGGLCEINDNRLDEAGYFDSDLPTYSIMTDRHGQLWMGTNDGILKWDGRELKRYDVTHGLIGNEVNRNALIYDDQGKIWVGTESGATVYVEAEDLSLNSVPDLSFTILTDGLGRSLDPSKNNEIPYEGRSITLEFLGISFLDENRISYRYKLQGWDDDWIALNNNENTTIRYTNLPFGDYQFTVQSKIEQGTWSEPISTSFTVKKPPYRQVWFVGLVTLAVVTLLYFIYRLRVMVLLKNQQRLRKMVAERTREISALNDNLEQKVMERTRELKNRNDRLSDYAYMNAHLLRAPLARIQSLTYLIEGSDDKKLDTKLLKILKDSVEELDQVIFNINHVLKEEEMNE